MKCGEPYSPQHKCPKLVPLHVMEEVLELLQMDNKEDSCSEAGSQDSEAELLCLSYFAAAGIQGKRTIRLQGVAQDKDILILVDSGSSASFISEALVDKLQLPPQSCAPVQVKIADGGQLSSAKVVQQ